MIDAPSNSINGLAMIYSYHTKLPGKPLSDFFLWIALAIQMFPACMARSSVVVMLAASLRDRNGYIKKAPKAKQ